MRKIIKKIVLKSIEELEKEGYVHGAHGNYSYTGRGNKRLTIWNSMKHLFDGREIEINAKLNVYDNYKYLSDPFYLDPSWIKYEVEEFKDIAGLFEL